MKTFTLKTDFFDNETIICIGGEFGAIGTLTVVRLLCAIHQSGYYLQWSERTAYRLLRDIPGLDRKTLNRIIKRLIYWKMFDAAMFKKHSVLTSTDLQQRYFKAVSRRRRALQSPEPIPYLLIPLQPEPQPSPDSPQNPHRNPNQKVGTLARASALNHRNSLTTLTTLTTLKSLNPPIKHTTRQQSAPTSRPTTLRLRTIPINRIFRHQKHPRTSSTKPHHQPRQSSASLYSKMPRR